MTAPEAAACYVYGVVPAGVALPPGARGIGAPAAEVSLVRHGRLAALVSGVPAARAARRDLLAHSRLLDGVAATTPVLPVRFGTVLPGERAVAGELLAPRHDQLAAALAALDGCAQFTVKARYVEEAVLREVLAEEPEVARWREVLRDQPGGGTYYQRIQLGELVAAAVARRREADAATLVGRLARHATAVAHHPPADGGTGIADAAFLVERGAWPALEQEAEGIARRWDGRARLRLLGPLAPYDFAGALDGAGEGG